MDRNQIEATGNLLMYYNSDLTYIWEFQKYMSGETKEEDYLKKSPGTFKYFINEFRVARNVKKDKTRELLKITKEWVATSRADDVDAFAKKLKEKKITQDRKLMLSLASKILLLSNPWSILPFDNFTKKAVELKDNDYKEFLIKIKAFEKDNSGDIEQCLQYVNKHLEYIEYGFKGELKNIDLIRQNRFLDKWLWTIGKSK